MGATRELSLDHLELATGESDAELVRRLRAGDRAAFQDLYRRHVARVRAVLVRLLGPALLDDLTQEVFLRVWSSLTTLRDAEYLGTWIYRVTVNVATDALRRKQRWARWYSPEDPDTLAAPALPDTVARLDTQRLVAKALAALDFNHRAVLVLYEMEELPQAEIGEILGIAAGTVKSRLFHARRKVREFLAQEGIEL